MNKQTVQQMRLDLAMDLAGFEKKYGVKVTIGNARFSSTHVKFQFEVAEVDNSGTTLTPGVTALKTSFPNLVNKTVTMSTGELGTIVEYHPRKHKYPFIVVTRSGGRYKITRNHAQTAV